MKYFTIALVTILAAGCAGHPPQEPAAVVAQPAAGDAKLEPKQVANAKRMGYTVVDQNGETLFCRTQGRTGSHLQQDTYCMTAADFDALRERTQQSLSNSSRTVPPPVGH